VTRTLISELPEKIEERVRIRGWVQAIRDQKSVQFVIVRDETGMAQVVLPKQDPPSELNERVSALTAESAVTLTGTVAADERVKLGGLELRLEDLEVDSLAEPEVPIAADSALDKRIDWRYLDLRRPDRRLIFEVQTAVERAMREYWHGEGFFELHSPKLMGSASESGAELFKVEYFEGAAYRRSRRSSTSRWRWRRASARSSRWARCSARTRRSRHGTTRSSRAWTWRSRGSTRTRT
jgi:aspartyl/asparaginyl-tRNA synthetase